MPKKCQTKNEQHRASPPARPASVWDLPNTK